MGTSKIQFKHSDTSFDVDFTNFKFTPINYADLVTKFGPVSKWSFGGTSKTWTIPLTVEKVPVKKVRPEEVGIKIPGISWIGLNGCAGKGKHGEEVSFTAWSMTYAHAHICKKDPNVGMFCTNEKWLFNPDGTYSEVTLHEVAHILADYPMITETCGEGIGYHTYKIKMDTKATSISEFAHSYPGWVKLARKFGIKSPGPYCSQETTNWIHGLDKGDISPYTFQMEASSNG